MAEGECSRPLYGPGGAADFDDEDAPIRPLQSHYHTRAAIYYTSRGSSHFNDPLDERPATSGELRFVSAGHYYGPETLWDDSYVISLHEADPAARRVRPNHDPPAGFSPCAFACFDEPAAGGTGAMRCVVAE